MPNILDHHFSKHRFQPVWNRFRQKLPLSILKNRRQAEWRWQVVVVKNENAGKLPDGLFEIAHGARKPRGQFVARHIMSTLADAHGDPFFGAAIRLNVFRRR